MIQKKVTLGSICDLVNGKAFKPSDWSTSGVPIVRIQNLNGSNRPFNYFVGSLSNQVQVKNGDLLLAWSGTPGTSFGAHIWRGKEAILNQHIFRCDINRGAITAEWAKFVINAQLDQLVDLAHGGVGLKHVTRGVVEDLEIPLPRLSEQRRIAEVLDRAEALRAKRRAALAQLDTLTQSIFLDLFGDPVENPMNFPRTTLGEVIEFVGGSQPPRETFTYEESCETVRLVQIRDFRSDAFKTYIPRKLAKRSFAEDDVMIGRYGPPVFQILRGLSGSYNVALMKATLLAPYCFGKLMKRCHCRRWR